MLKYLKLQNEYINEEYINEDYINEDLDYMYENINTEEEIDLIIEELEEEIYLMENILNEADEVGEEKKAGFFSRLFNRLKNMLGFLRRKKKIAEQKGDEEEAKSIAAKIVETSKKITDVKDKKNVAKTKQKKSGGFFSKVRKGLGFKTDQEKLQDEKTKLNNQKKKDSTADKLKVDKEKHQKNVADYAESRKPKEQRDREAKEARDKKKQNRDNDRLRKQQQQDRIEKDKQIKANRNKAQEDIKNSGKKDKKGRTVKTKQQKVDAKNSDENVFI